MSSGNSFHVFIPQFLSLCNDASATHCAWFNWELFKIFLVQLLSRGAVLLKDTQSA